MLATQPVPGLAGHRVQGQCRTEVVAQLHEVVGTPGGMALLEAPARIATVGVHVPALPNAARGQLRQPQCLDIPGAHQGSTVIGRHHAATQFTGGERMVRGPSRQVRNLGGLPVVGADAVIITNVAGVEVGEAAVVTQVLSLDPERIGVAAVHGQHVRRQLGRSPSSGRPDGSLHPASLGDAAQLTQVLGPVVEFVVHLQPEQLDSSHLMRQRSIPACHFREVGRIVGADLPGPIRDAIRQSSVPHLGVHVRPDPEDHPEAMADRGPQEGTHVQPAVERQLTVATLVVVPDGVGRHMGEPTGTRSQQHLVPELARHPRVVNLARDWKDW